MVSKFILIIFYFIFEPFRKIWSWHFSSFIFSPDDSEDPYGQPTYVQGKDTNYVRDQRAIRAKEAEYAERRKSLLLRNQTLAAQGKSQVAVPDEHGALSSRERKEYARKFTGYREAFYKNIGVKRKNEAQKLSPEDEGNREMSEKQN